MLAWLASSAAASSKTQLFSTSHSIVLGALTCLPRHRALWTQVAVNSLDRRSLKVNILNSLRLVLLLIREKHLSLTSCLGDILVHFTVPGHTFLLNSIIGKVEKNGQKWPKSITILTHHLRLSTVSLKQFGGSNSKNGRLIAAQWVEKYVCHKHLVSEKKC